MTYREMFEQKMAADKTTASDLISMMVDADRAGHLSVSLAGYDREGGIEAFILERHTDVRGGGIRNAIKYGVVVGNRAFSSGYYTVRGSYASEPDDFASWYRTIKILEQTGNALVIGLESGERLVIAERRLDNGDEFPLETYHLDEERKQAKQAAELAKIANAATFEEKVKAAVRLIASKYGKDRELKPNFYPELPGVATIKVHIYNRDYDAEIVRLDYWLVRAEEAEPRCILQQLLSYQRQLNRDRFYTIDAELNYGTPVQRDGTTVIPISGEIVADGGSTTFDRWRRKQADVAFELVF